MTDFSRRLRDARHAAGLTQVALADRLNCQQGWIARLESGTMTHIQVDTLVRLCHALHVSADHLLGLEPRHDHPHH
jgi:transcriptional regulator with XRE-family HTH domain